LDDISRYHASERKSPTGWVRHARLDTSTRKSVYLTFPQNPIGGMSLAIKTEGRGSFTPAHSRQDELEQAIPQPAQVGDISLQPTAGTTIVELRPSRASRHPPPTLCRWRYDC